MKKYLLILLLFAALPSFSQVDKIRITNVSHDKQGSTSYSAEYRVPLPVQLVGIPHSLDILKAYMGIYNVKGLDTVGTDIYLIFEINASPLGVMKVVDNVTTEFPNMPEDFYAPLEAQYAELEYALSQFQLLPSDAIIGKVLINNQWVNSN
jgi:hypothetical protein